MKETITTKCIEFQRCLSFFTAQCRVLGEAYTNSASYASALRVILSSCSEIKDLAERQLKLGEPSIEEDLDNFFQRVD